MTLLAVSPGLSCEGSQSLGGASRDLDRGGAALLHALRFAGANGPSTLGSASARSPPASRPSARRGRLELPSRLPEAGIADRHQRHVKRG